MTRPLTLLALLPLLLPAIPAAAQEAPPLDQQAVRLLSIDPSYPGDADLGPVLDAIGDRRIVVLAERTPGDAAALWAKSRLARALIRDRGFTVVAFEAGLYDCRSMNQQFAAGTDASMCPGVGLDEQWATSGYMVLFFQDIWKSYFKPTPVDVCGIDYRMTSSRTPRHLPRDLLDYLGSLNPHPLDKELRRHMLTVLERLRDAVEDHDDAGVVGAWEDLHRLSNLLSENKQALIEAAGAGEFAFWERILQDQIANAEDAMSFDLEPTGLADDNERQQRLAERLAWFANEVYPNRKIIVWCSAVSALANADDVTLDQHEELIVGFQSAGAAWRDTFADQLYTIAFDTGDGVSGLAGRGQPHLPPPATRPGSFEEKLSDLDWPLLFIPLGEHAPRELRRPLKGNLIGLNPWLAERQRLAEPVVVSADWSTQFDAVIFIEATWPNSSSDKVPEGIVHTVHLE